jgi:hypothetical protein
MGRGASPNGRHRTGAVDATAPSLAASRARDWPTPSNAALTRPQEGERSLALCETLTMIFFGTGSYSGMLQIRCLENAMQELPTMRRIHRRSRGSGHPRFVAKTQILC